MKKTCSRCKEEKDLSEFDKKKDKLCPHCKACRKIYVSGHYAKNKQYYKDKAKRNRYDTSKKYNAYKESLSCTDCGLSFKGKPYLCDFHHPNNDKEFTPATLKDRFKTFIEEVKKCVPLCANCHRIRHNESVV